MMSLGSLKTSKPSRREAARGLLEAGDDVGEGAKEAVLELSVELIHGS